MGRTAFSWLTALVVAVAFSSEATAALLGIQVSGQFAPCGASTLPPPCGAYGGTFVIDTDASASPSDLTSATYPLQSASITLNQPTTVISGAPSVTITNESSFDSLLFYVAGSGMEFKVNFDSPASTVSDFSLTEENVLALIGSATTKEAYVKYTPPQGSEAAFAFAVSLSIEQFNVAEPGSLALLGLGLAGMAATRRRRK